MLHSCMWHDACLLFLVSLFALIFSLVTFSTMNDVESGPSTTGKPSSTSMHEEDVPTKNPLEHDKSSLTQTDFHPEPASPHPDQQAHCSTAGAAETSAQSLPRALAHNLAAMVSTPRTKAPKDTLKAVYVAGTYKAALTLDILMVQSFMAGLYIGMASHLYLAIGGGVLGAIFFPTGLVAVLLTSAELFTGDALIFVASVLGGKVTLRSLCRNWTVSWICNFVGCLAWAYFMVYLPDSLGDLDKNEYAVKVALAKAHQPSGAIFLKGVGANFMVCLGVWQYTCAEEVAGKVLALFFPIAGFVIMGFDHCIANQFFIPMGMMLGADISMTRLLFQALLPATLGNLVGGGLLVGAVYWYVFDSMDTIIRFRERIHYGRKRPAIIGSDNESPAFTTPATSLHQPIDLDNGQSSSKRYPDINRRFRRQTSTPDLTSRQGGT